MSGAEEGASGGPVRTECETEAAHLGNYRICKT